MSGKRITKRLGGITQIQLQSLSQNGLDFVEKFLVTPDIDLLYRLNWTFDEVLQVRKIVCNSVLPRQITLKELSLQRQSHPILKTRLPILDTYLNGIIPNSVTELAGSAGIGKTQFCMMLASLALLPPQLGGLSQALDDRVLFIDTENSFSPQRISDILLATEPNLFTHRNDPSLASAMSRIYVLPISTSAAFGQLLVELESLIIERNIKLVIVDSVAALVRHEFDSSSIFKRQNLLGTWVSDLKTISESFHIPIVVTNQVASTIISADTASSSTTSTTAALGTGWFHGVNTRLLLEPCNPPDFDIPLQSAPAYIRLSVPLHSTLSQDTKLCCMTISKSPTSPVLSFPYFICSSGLACVKTTDTSINQENVHIANRYIFALEESNYAFN